MKLINIIQRKLHHSTFNYLINNLFEEVSDDIKIIQDEIYTNNPDPLVNYTYEKYELNSIVKEYIKRKYQNKYCPTSLFNYFNKSEKVNYLILRNKIDKMLQITDTIYQI